MKVSMLLRSTYPPDIRVRKEATALADAGHDVEVICLPDDRQARETVDGVDVRRVPGLESRDDAGGLARTARYLLTGVHPDWRRQLEAAIDRGAEVIHVHDLPLVRTALSVRNDVATEVSVVADLHEHYPAAEAQLRRPIGELDPTDLDAAAIETLVGRLCLPVRRLRRFERQAVRRADATLAVVAEARQCYLALGAAPERVHVVSNTVDLETFDATLGERPAAVADADGPVLTYVGSLSGRHRGLQTVVDGLPDLLEAHPRAQVVFVGAGSYEEPLRDRVAARGVEDRVTVTGWVDVKRVPGYMAASDVGLVPHLATEHTNTTVPHKLFQNMAASTPVVAGDADPLERILAETDAGETFAAGEPAAFAACAAGLLADPDRAAACGRNGRAAVESTYNWARDAERLRDVYASL